MPDGGPVRMICSDRSSDILIVQYFVQYSANGSLAEPCGALRVHKLPCCRASVDHQIQVRPAVRRGRRQPEIPTHGRPGDAVDCLANLSANFWVSPEKTCRRS